MAGNARKKKKNKTEITWKELRRQKVLIFWAGVFGIYGFIFCYLPLGGWLMAFQNYKPKDGILHSKFIGLAKFQQLFSDATFLRVIRNTLAMGVINLVLTPLWLNIMYGNAFVISGMRLIKNAVKLPLDTALLYFLLKAVETHRKKAL